MRLDDEISALRQEIGQFRTETRQRLEVIENEVNKQVALNYNRTIIDYVTEMSHDIVENLKCDRPDMETYCKTSIGGVQSEYLSLLKAGRFTDSYNALEAALIKLNQIKEGFVEDGYYSFLLFQ